MIRGTPTFSPGDLVIAKTSLIPWTRPIDIDSWPDTKGMVLAVKGYAFKRGCWFVQDGQQRVWRAHYKHIELIYTV